MNCLEELAGHLKGLLPACIPGLLEDLRFFTPQLQLYRHEHCTCCSSGSRAELEQQLQAVTCRCAAIPWTGRDESSEDEQGGPGKSAMRASMDGPGARANRGRQGRPSATASEVVKWKAGSAAQSLENGALSLGSDALSLVGPNLPELKVNEAVTGQPPSHYLSGVRSFHALAHSTRCAHVWCMCGSFFGHAHVWCMHGSFFGHAHTQIHVREHVGAQACIQAETGREGS